MGCIPPHTDASALSAPLVIAHRWVFLLAAARSQEPNDLVLLGVDARAINASVVWWEPMYSNSRSSHRLAAAAAASLVLLAIGLPSASAAPAAPATDGQGYVDSTARCAPPATAVLFGSTDSSRVAVCKTSGGHYEYRGVR